MSDHPYDVVYLQEIVETQGLFFERLQDELPTIDGIDFIRNYMKSVTRGYIDKGEPYVATLDIRRLMEYYLKIDKFVPKEGTPLLGFKPNWIGQFYARYQWEMNIPSSKIVDMISPEWLLVAYNGLHDLDLKLAVEKVNQNLILTRPRV